MSLTPATLPRHELIGLPVRVVDATDPGLVGIEGRVVRETTSTLLVESAASSDDARTRREPRVRQVPKRGATFEFALTDETADGDSPPATGAREGSGTGSEPRGASDGVAQGRAGAARAARGEGPAHVTVDGARLHARPAERTETTGDSKWR